jgi:hypothetical protein
MLPGDTSRALVTQGDTTKSRCVTPQQPTPQPLMDRVTQVTQIHRKVPYARKSHFTCVVREKRATGVLAQALVCVTCVTPVLKGAAA